jgi:hypothetical protein
MQLRGLPSTSPLTGAGKSDERSKLKFHFDYIRIRIWVHITLKRDPMTIPPRKHYIQCVGNTACRLMLRGFVPRGVNRVYGLQIWNGRT